MKQFRQKKRSMGQVFLKEQWPVKRMIQVLDNWNVDEVLEIGPGPAILTKGLLDAGYKVTAVEKDDYLYEQLVEMKTYGRIEKAENLDLVHEDILKFDLRSWVKDVKGSKAIVGNIPYNISSPILISSLTHIENLAGIAFLTQLEFAMRVTAPPNTKAYGSLSVFAQLRSKPHLECKVDRACFKPPPRVDSGIISITHRDHKLSTAAMLKIEHICRTSFMQRRKVLRNAIKPFLTEENESTCPIDLGRRPETLTPEEFILLAKHFFPDAFGE